MPEANPEQAMSALNELYLEVDGRRYDASGPEWGDATLEEVDRPGSADVFALPENRGHVTIGLTMTEIAQLQGPVQHAVLRTRDGDDPVLELRIEKIVPELGVVVCVPISPTIH